jgi:hypothetical protein
MKRRGQPALPVKRRARSVSSWKRSARSSAWATRKWAACFDAAPNCMSTAGSPGQLTLTYHIPSTSKRCGSIVATSALAMPCCFSTKAWRPRGVFSYSTSLMFKGAKSRSQPRQADRRRDEADHRRCERLRRADSFHQVTGNPPAKAYGPLDPR